MDADKPTIAEVRPIIYILPYTQGKEEPAMNNEMNNDKKTPILPLALRETEITETDIETMLRIARDKKATSGRYKRTPKPLSTNETVLAPK